VNECVIVAIIMEELGPVIAAIERVLDVLNRR
jgi:hypothetical protein